MVIQNWAILQRNSLDAIAYSRTHHLKFCEKINSRLGEFILKSQPLQFASQQKSIHAIKVIFILFI